jgi:hypothetical protein
VFFLQSSYILLQNYLAAEDAVTSQNASKTGQFSRKARDGVLENGSRPSDPLTTEPRTTDG